MNQSNLAETNVSETRFASEGRLPARLVAVCCWGYLAAAFGAWFLLSWADVWWPANLLLFGPRWTLTLPLIGLFPAALLLRRSALGLLAIAGLILVGPVMGFCLPWQNLFASPPAGTRFRVLTCNMHYTKADAARVERLVTETEPDIVALQEWPESNHTPYLTGPGWHWHRTPRLFLASRYPIQRVVNLGLHSSGPDGSVARYDLETPIGVIHFFSLHLASPRPGMAAMIHEDRRSPADIGTNISRRWEQSEKVAREAGSVSGPILLVGDFNTPPQSSIFRRVWGGYSDAFSSAGWGWGYTFFDAKTMARIDHVLVGEGWYCSRCQVGPDIGSPHRPVLADLIWPGSAVQPKK
jgi:vancomycin resistance protein VanJ